MPRWNETIYPPPPTEDNAPLTLRLAGITHPDPRYRVSRPESNGLYVLEYVIRGRGHVTYGDRRFSPGGGDAYLLQPQAASEYRSDPENPWEKIWFNLSGPLMDSLCGAYLLHGAVYFPGCPLREDFFRAMELVRERQPDCVRRLALEIHNILAVLYEYRKNSALPRRSPEAVLLKEHLDLHWQRQVTIAELARLIRKSPAQMLRIFRREYDDTPGGYLCKHRNRFARQYLENTDYPIKALASLLGFKDEFYFSNWFKRHNGMSPQSYRRSLR